MVEVIVESVKAERSRLTKARSCYFSISRFALGEKVLKEYIGKIMMEVETAERSD